MIAGVSARLITRFSAAGQRGDQREMLIDHAQAQPLGDAWDRSSATSRPATSIGARRRAVEPHHRISRCVDLPAPFSPRSAWKLPRFNVDRHVVQRGEVAETHRHVQRLDADRAIVLGSCGSATKFLRLHCAAGSALMQRRDQSRCPKSRRRRRPASGPSSLRSLMVALVGGAAAVGQHDAFKAAVIGLAHGGVHADIGGDAGQDQVGYAPRAQDQFKVGGAEADPLPGLSMIISPGSG
jgi:hypothetical protein